MLHCWRDVVFRRVALRVATFFLCAVGVHALLPLLVSDAHWFGIGWAFYGIGALTGAFFFPRLARSMPLARQLTAGIALHAAMLGLISLAGSDLLLTALLLVASAAWYVVVSAAQLAVQRELPDALRARSASRRRCRW